MGFKSWSALLERLRSGTKIVGPGLLDSAAKSVQLTMTGDSTRDLYPGSSPSERILGSDPRQTFLSLLESEPEPSPSELEAFLTGMKTTLFRLKPVMKKVSKHLPFDPGGRRKKFSSGKEQRICKAVRWLIDHTNTPRLQIYQQVADQERVSRITVQRMWRKCCKAEKDRGTERSAGKSENG
jgi:hypothetical protein